MSTLMRLAVLIMLTCVWCGQSEDRKIDHFVVLFMENQVADNFFGCMDRPGLDNIRHSRIPKDPSNTSKGFYTFNCNKEYVCARGPGNTAEPGDTVIDLFGPEQIPVKQAIGEQFGLFNRLYSSVPAASSPNHLFAQALVYALIHHELIHHKLSTIPLARAGHVGVQHRACRWCTGS